MKCDSRTGVKVDREPRVGGPMGSCPVAVDKTQDHTAA